jgi:hypothetical protein
LQFDSGRGKILHIVEIAKDGALRHAGNLCDPSGGGVRFSIRVEIQER